MKKLITKLAVNYKYSRKISRLREAFHNIYMKNHFDTSRSKQYKFGYEVTIRYFEQMIDRYDVSFFNKIINYSNMLKAFDRHKYNDILKHSKCYDNKEAFRGSIDACADARNAIDLVPFYLEIDMLSINKI
jgi:hypothetical protein